MEPKIVDSGNPLVARCTRLAGRRRPGAGVMTASPRRVLTALLLAALPVALGGCSNASAMTCREFTAKNLGEQGTITSNLLIENDLDPGDVGNIQGVTAAVSKLCRSDPSATLQDATDWKSRYW